MYFGDFGNFVTAGDVFILKDNLVKDKDVPPDNSRIIRFQRPAIVLHTGYKISTVIPLTTKDNSPETSYLVKVSPDVVSRALFSQVTTVDNFRLGKKLGVICSNVFENLAHKYSEYILGKTPHDYYRDIPIPGYGTDMISFEPFAYYRDNSNHERIILSITNGITAYYLTTSPIQSPNSLSDFPKKMNGKIPGVIGRNIDLNCIHFLCDEYHDTNWTCIGYETVEATREKILEVINEIFNIKLTRLNTERYSNIMEFKLTPIIIKSFGSNRYMEGFNFIMSINTEDLFSDKVYQLSFLTNYCNPKNTDYLVNFMRDLHFHRINLLGCSIEQLEWLNSNMHTALSTSIMRFSDNFAQTAQGNTLDIDLNDDPNIKEENKRWIADRINEILNNLNSKAKMFASVMNTYKNQKSSKRGKRK